MHPVGEPVFDDADPLQWPDLSTNAGRSVRLFGGGVQDLLFARIEEDLTLEVQIAGVSLLIMHVSVRLAVEELGINVQPTGGASCQQSFAIGAGPANSIRREQAIEIQRLPENRCAGIAIIHGGGRILKQALVAFEPRAAFF